MKWRQSIIYFVVLLLAGGYFYYFEVVKKEQKQAADKEAKKVFSFKIESVQALEVYSKDKQSVKLKKDNQWEIVEPIHAGVDKGALDDFLRTLSTLESERKIVEAPQELKPYGLDDPPLRIRFQTADQWLELSMGEKTPVGSGRYANLGEKKDVLLVAEGNWSVLNKGLNELRRRELFTFQPEDVIGIEVAWQDGSIVSVAKQPEANTWKAPDQPDMKIKKSKVDNVIEQVHWLRAQSFQENEVKNLDSYGLNPPYVTIKLRLRGDLSTELMMADKQKQDKQVSAVSSELSSVVQIDASVLTDLPKSPQALEDRSLLGDKSESFKQVKWRMGDSSAHVVRIDENKWGLKKGETESEPLKDSWHVKSLFWDLDDSEYVKRMDPQPEIPAQPYARLELLDGEKNMVILSWQKPEAKGEEPTTVWIERGGETLAVQVRTDSAEKIARDLERILHPEQDKNPS